MMGTLTARAAAAVTIDTSAAPEHAKWAEQAKPVAEAWLPRLVNLLAVPGSGAVPDNIKVTVTPAYKGVAAASGDRITMASEWVREHPEDAVGALIHELVHVIQGYPGGSEHWLTEGIADYVRWGIYEGKPPGYFPRPGKPQGYRDAYQVAAGFLLWLESGEAPGIVRSCHAALKAGRYTQELFRTATGKSLDELWRAYTAAAEAPSGRKLPAKLVRLAWKENGGGSLAPAADGEWIEEQGGREHARFKETGRSESAVDLHDASRGIRLRLTADGVLLERGGRWMRLYAAGWEGGE